MVTLQIQRRYFDAIALGQKTVEGRLDGPRLTGLSVGEPLVLQCDAQRMICTVRSVDRYPSFSAMLKDVGLQAALPGVDTLAEGVAIYRSFPGYERDEEQGVVAIGV